MRNRDDDRFRPKVGPPKSGGQAQPQKFVSRVLKETSKAGKRFGVRSPKTLLRVGAKLARGHVAARFAAQSLGPKGRRATVKVLYVVGATHHPRSTSKHLRYIERDSATRNGEPGRLFGPQSDQVDRTDFERSVKGDRHHFRIIVSPEDGAELGDLKAYTRQLMGQVERDLGTPLQWVAADHWDTGHPHIHIYLRGKDASGSDLVIAGEYISHGFRHRASEIETEWLGPRTDLEIRQGLTREIEQERWTGLDRTLKHEAQDGRVTLWPDATTAESRFRHACLVGRLQKLEALGLATKRDVTTWELAPHAESTLRTMGERGDIIRTMQRALGAARRAYAVFDPAAAQIPVVGRVAGKGLADELADRGYLIVDGIDGRAHYVATPAHTDLDTYPMGAIVEVGEAAPRPADETIRRVAQDGVYRTDRHLEIASESPRAGFDPQAFVQSHVRRLEALRRAGLVERLDEGVWRVPADLPERGRAYDARRTGGAHIELRSGVPLQQQIRAIGATWLDGQLVSGSQITSTAGFGGEVRAALNHRTEYLIEQGLANRQGQRVLFAQNLLNTLRTRDLDTTLKAMEADSGRPHRVLTDGQRATGIYRRAIDLPSGRYALLDEGKGFSLVPWRPVIEPRLGQSLSAVMQGERVSWELGRSRGLAR